MKLNEELVELCSKHIKKIDKIRLKDLSSLDKMSSVYMACLGKRHLEPNDYEIFQKYIINKAKTVQQCVGDLKS